MIFHKKILSETWTHPPTSILNTDFWRKKFFAKPLENIFGVLQRYEHLVELVGEICHEKGLDVQNYQCCGCSRPIGMCQSQLLLFFLLIAVRTPHAKYYALFVGCVWLLNILAVFIAKFKITK